MTERARRQRARRQQARKWGLWAEILAANFLRAKGYRIFARNWRVPVGEVDIIAARGKWLIFVEVKARKSRDEGLWAVSARQQQRVTRAANAYIAANPQCANMHVRFDVMAVAPWRLPTHSQAAWGYDS